MYVISRDTCCIYALAKFLAFFVGTLYRDRKAKKWPREHILGPEKNIRILNPCVINVGVPMLRGLTRPIGIGIYVSGSQDCWSFLGLLEHPDVYFELTRARFVAPQKAKQCCRSILKRITLLVCLLKTGPQRGLYA